MANLTELAFASDILDLVENDRISRMGNAGQRLATGWIVNYLVLLCRANKFESETERLSLFIWPK